MGARILPVLVVLLAVIVLIASSTFVVREQELALRVQLSKIQDSDFKPGLHFKFPLVDSVLKFDKRVLTRKFNGETFLTSESQGLTIDYYIKWRIKDASQYYQSTGGDEQNAARLLGDKIQDGIKNAIARRTLKDIVASDRNEVTGEFMQAVGKFTDDIGITLVDVRVQSIDLQEEVATSVYDSMKRGFEGTARMERGEGEKQKNIVMAEADRKRTEIIAKSAADAQKIRGDGDAQAAAIYAAAYNRNPEFYSFWRSLQAYNKSLGTQGDVLVISPDSEFFKYLKTPAPQRR